MNTRAADIDAFLTQAGWHEATRHSMASDLSTRTYARLVATSGRTVILMDALPEQDASTPAFVVMNDWLRGAGLNVPEILCADIENGLLLLEDLGDTRLADTLAGDDARRATAYSELLDILILIRCQIPPALHRPEAEELVNATALADAHYPGMDSARLETFRAILTGIVSDVLATGPATVSLRDFHAENVMWLPDRPGLQKFGLLDYQDAFVTHPVYDLVSLLTDARTDISRDLRRHMIGEYLNRSDDDAFSLNLAFAAFSAIRNLRILGIFARAATLFGKTGHVDKLPRVHGYLVEALGHSAFASVRDEALAAIPTPTTALMDTLR